MEKRISFRDFQSAKNVAKTIDPYLVQKKKCQEQIASLEDTFKAKFTEKAQQLFNRLQEAQAKEKERLENLLEEIDHKIDLYEAGILRDTGFHTTDLVKKVIEPTGKTDAPRCRYRRVRLYRGYRNSRGHSRGDRRRNLG